jgi:ABC-type sugar transport system ATPase subunit
LPGGGACVDEYKLEARNISKRFPGTLALNGVSVEFVSGTVHALIGKNGSGKSTLIKIISGVYGATSGELYLYDKKIEHSSTAQAMQNGICTVYQELSLVNDLTVGENIFLGRLPTNRVGGVKWDMVHSEARRALDELGVSIDTMTYVAELSVGQQQLVEIAKVMSFQPKVLILDEPTSALSDRECERFFSVIKALREKNIIIVFITHRLQELYTIADRVTVLRDGELVSTENISSLKPKDIVNKMFGEVEHKAKPASYVLDETVLEVKNMTSERFRNASFALRKGEVLGIAGMMGSGRTELLRAIFGIDKFSSGEIIVNNKTVNKRRIAPHAMKKLGIGYTSENRKADGLCLNLSVGDNLCLASLYDISPRNMISRKMEKQYIEKQIDGLSIKTSDYYQPAFTMSGGNQQKVVVGNWLNTSPKIILMDEPSRGIDVSAKQQIFSIIWEEAKKGVSFVVISSELEELLEMCDRIIIMRKGELKEELIAKDLKTEQIYSKCMEEN